MCLIAVAHRAHPDYPLLLAANRDEYYARPTEGIHFWDSVPGLLAGKDLEAGGTWLGITRSGRFAAITNYRNPPLHPDKPRSRGELPLNFLSGKDDPADYLANIDGGRYAGFNLVVGTPGRLCYYSNVEDRVRELPAGIYSLCNGPLDGGWPKQVESNARLGDLLAGKITHEALAAAVDDRATAPDPALPDTGVGLELERALSPQFIVLPEYGTRATTTLSVAADGRVEMRERTYDARGEPGELRKVTFRSDVSE